jgi:hypothetical protein
MLSAEQLIIVAYTRGDCEVICRRCGEAGHEIMGHAMSAYEAGEWAGSNGLWCDDCGEEIEAPYTWTCPNCDTDYSGDEADEAESEFGWGPNALHKCSDECPGDEEEAESGGSNYPVADED